MRRTGTADLPLHGGRAPSWLFGRMTRLARAIVLTLREDEPPSALLKRLADPYWFQSFGCLLGFDWHSSGLPTTVCGALKEAMRGGVDAEVGLFVAGGKGGTSRKAPADIAMVAPRPATPVLNLVAAEGAAHRLGQPGVGARTMRAPSLAAEVMYGVPASRRDPAVYSYAHGGKDGDPYPVDRATYDATIACLESAVRRARLGEPDRLAALRRLGGQSRGDAHGG